MMHAWMLRIAWLAVLVGLAPLAHAQIHRCVGAHGEPEFSGQPCAPGRQQQSSQPIPQNRWGNLCAASPHALAEDIARAFQARDVNQLAGLILWRGIGQAAARGSLRALATWLQQPLAGISMVSGAGPPGGNVVASTGDPGAASRVVVMPPPPPPTGVEVATGGGYGDARYFGLTRIGACWWLTM